MLPRIVLVALCLFGVGTVNFTSGQDDVIRVDTTLVSVPITAVDRDGRYVLGLKKENFKVFEDGTEQEVEYFGSVNLPVTVLLLLDCSGSMGENLQTMAQAAGSFMSRLKVDDQVMILSFAHDVEEALPLTKLKDFPRTIQIHQRSRVHTRVYNAVDAALRKIENVKGRKAIILFTDGVSDEPDTLAKKNAHDAEEQEALIYTVRFAQAVPTARSNAPLKKSFNDGDAKSRDRRVTYADPNSGGDLDRKVNAYMTGLAAKSGGRAFNIDTITDLPKTFGDIAAELKRQYTLGYYSNNPNQPGGHRNLKVTVNIPNTIVRTRNGVTALKPKSN